MQDAAPSGPEGGERVGVLGGTFDPIHFAHLVAGRAAQHQLGLDRVMFVVANDPWQKRDRAPTAAEIRLEMVAAAVSGYRGLEASAIEISRGGPTYTVDTLEALQRPGRELFLILGADAVARLATWVRSDAIAALATLAIVSRAGDEPVAPTGPRWRHARVEMPRLDIAATDLRDRVRRGAPIDFLTPESVVRIISRAHLYTQRDGLAG